MLKFFLNSSQGKCTKLELFEQRRNILRFCPIVIFTEFQRGKNRTLHLYFGIRHLGVWEGSYPVTDEFG